MLRNSVRNSAGNSARNSVPSRQRVPQPKHQIIETANGSVLVDTNVLMTFLDGEPVRWLNGLDNGINPIGNTRRLADVKNWPAEKEKGRNTQRIKTVHNNMMLKLYQLANLNRNDIETSIINGDEDDNSLLPILLSGLRDTIVGDTASNNDEIAESDTTSLSGSLYTPTNTSDAMDFETDSDDDSSYHPQEDVKIMARTLGYDDECSSLDTSVITVDMEVEESEYSDSESDNEMEVGF